MEGRDRVEHCLALKVMRLTKPTLSQSCVPSSDTTDIAQGTPLMGNLFMPVIETSLRQKLQWSMLFATGIRQSAGALFQL